MINKDIGSVTQSYSKLPKNLLELEINLKKEKNMTIEYDNGYDMYEKYKESSPISLYVQKHTLFNILGDLDGKSILELGCGNGFFTRLLKQNGAAQVVGVDLSEKMLESAIQQETRKPLGIAYVHRDICDLGQMGHFDMVVAAFLLNHANTKEKLLEMCQNIFLNLKVGGRFVALNDNVQQPPESYSLCEKYGLTKHISAPLQEGTPITLTFTISGDRSISLVDYYLSKATYELAFQQAGFKSFRWHAPQISPEGIEKFGEEFWQDVINYPPLVGIECVK
jgi:SAM-dependent methyltransferase